MCTSPGYIHAISLLATRDSIVAVQAEMKPEDLQRMSSMDRLSRPEITALVGLALKGEIDYEFPGEEQQKHYVSRTEALLKELHGALSAGGLPDWSEMLRTGANPFQRGAVLREPIFYTGESAYAFQYREFALRKYHNDAQWLTENKGFDIATAATVVRAVGKVHNEQVLQWLNSKEEGKLGSLLQAHVVSPGCVAAKAGVSEELVRSVLDAFCVGDGVRNPEFKALTDFNVAAALPLLRHGAGYLLLQEYSLSEALYEAPFYWMGADKAYAAVSLKHRGQFTETFARDLLVRAFGEAQVFTNIDVLDGKKRVSEIDILVTYGDRAIVLQAKSKRLSLQAKQGDELKLQDDFKKSIQDSYDQAYLCAECLGDAKFMYRTADGQPFAPGGPFKEIYPMCVVADHYPALTFQARQFLKTKQSDVIKLPFVLDVFALDAVTEFLSSPLRFLAYVNRRAMHAETVVANSELTVLGYHLKNNLWFVEENTLVMLTDDLSASLDIAMFARRDGASGKATPEGILTRFEGTALARVLDGIDGKEHAGLVDLGFLLQSLGEETFLDLESAVQKLAVRTRQDGKVHDVTALFGQTGITIHVTPAADDKAHEVLRSHCLRRKYTSHASKWFGICLRPDLRLRFVVGFDFEWQKEETMEEVTAGMATPPGNLKQALRAWGGGKVGRNDPCPCGSGRKYKHCCLNRAHP